MVTRIKKVDRLVIQEIVDRIVASVHPEKIILFGSYAYGQPHNDSDLDILVIVESCLPRYKRAVPIYNSLAGLLIPKDVVVYTPEEVEAWSNVPQAFITTVMNKGRILYEKQQSRPGSRMA
ncbi:nucleotidyltransferase domain-containing protein [Candidatus Bipolaricaulota bacterium]|nr:nucleotidyltransferase domain-containing protein [Candidatus Bipolaricaulota bacterium]MCK4598732.1 nucleotidyltransferase domain-containing protein [Candidatus Bipolaricaulota bacterium]